MHKGDYHTDYSKYYDNEYKDKDLAYEHIKSLKGEQRRKLGGKESENVMHTTSEQGESGSKVRKVVRRVRKNPENK